MTEEIITKRLHVSGLTPAITPADLSQKLGSFGSIKALDGFGKPDGLGHPRKFGYVTIETTKPKLARCMNLLSGVTWKGAKLRIGEAKPDFRERLAKERAAAEDGEPPRKKRRLPKGVQGVHAADMSLVTPENVSTRGGWKVTPLGRLVRPIRMRPDKPLPEPVTMTTAVKGKGKLAKGAETKKKKRAKEPPVRARRQTIDPLKYGSQQVKGVFLDAVVALDGERKEVARTTQVVQESSGESSSDESEEEYEKEGEDAAIEKVQSITKASEALVQPLVQAEKPQRPPSPSPPPAALTVNAVPSDGTDLAQERNAALGLLQLLFGGRDENEWGEKESLGSDVDMEELKGQARMVSVVEDEDDIEVVPMEVDERQPQEVVAQDREDTPATEGPPASAPAPAPVAKPTKLKELFAPREEEAGFSLLEHLDLDDELVDDLDAAFVPQAPAAPAAAESIQPTSLPSSTTAQVRFTLDQSAPLFFPIPEDQRTGFRGRVKDPLDVAREKGWDWRKFGRTQTAEEIRQKWEEQKVELTKDWKRRHREAIKSRRRRGGGGDGE